MTWNPELRRYEDNDGRPLTPAEVRKHIDDYIQAEQKEVNRRAERLLVGAITLTAFFEFMRQKVTAWHGVTGVIAYGGEDQMTGEQWSRVNQRIISELTYLNEFEQAAQQSFTAAETIASQTVSHLADEIPAGMESLVEERVAEALLRAAPSEAESIIQATVKDVLADSLGSEAATAVADAVRFDKAAATILDSLIGGTIPSRSASYASASYKTYENNVKARESDFGITLARRVSEDDESSCEECPPLVTEEFIPLDEITDIGDTVCGSRCRCFYEFSFEGVEPIRIDETVNEIFAR